MKELGSWIPQLFYDLIGRVAPGVFLLLVVSGLFNDAPFVTAALKFGHRLETTEAVVLALALAYMVGIVVGGVAYLIIDDELFTDVNSIAAQIPTAGNTSNLSGNEVAFLYDALQYLNPVAGARLAKLRAEQHMCRVLWAGSLMLILLRVTFAAQQTDAEREITGWRLPAMLGLVVTLISARAFYLHLEVRSRRLLLNYGELLIWQRAPLAGSNEPPVDVTHPGERLRVAERLRLLGERLRLLIWWPRPKRSPGRQGDAAQ